MKPFYPKEYCRHLVVFNFYRKDAFVLYFGAAIGPTISRGFLKEIIPTAGDWRILQALRILLHERKRWQTR